MAKSTIPEDYLNNDLTGNSVKIPNNKKITLIQENGYFDPSRLPVCRTLAFDSYRELCELHMLKLLHVEKIMQQIYMFH